MIVLVAARPMTSSIFLPLRALFPRHVSHDFLAKFRNPCGSPFSMCNTIYADVYICFFPHHVHITVIASSSSQQFLGWHVLKAIYKYKCAPAAFFFMISATANLQCHTIYHEQERARQKAVLKLLPTENCRERTKVESKPFFSPFFFTSNKTRNSFTRVNIYID